MCDFISKYKNDMNYDWYIKIRPEIILLNKINFNTLSDISINARARTYKGPKIIKYGSSVGGEGMWKKYKDCEYNIDESIVILDDQIYLFNNNVIENGGFKEITHYIDSNREDEIFHTNYWKMFDIPLNVIGINILFTYPIELGSETGLSGHINVDE
jgi:hypothetical protein